MFLATHQKKIYFSVLAVCLFLGTNIAMAALVPCGGEGQQQCTLCHIIIGFKVIFDWLMKLLLGATILAITIAGVFYMISSGNKGMIDKAKTGVTYALVAFVIGMGCWLGVNMVMTMLGFKNAGSWWQFECDTTPTVPTSAGAPNQSGNPGGATNPPAAPSGNGDCGGVKGQTEACKYLTKDLEGLLACIKGKVSTAYDDAKGSSVAYSGEPIAIDYFINTAFAAGSMTAGYLQKMSDLQNCAGENWSKANCNHMKYSCHYGGRNCAGQINAADFETGDLNAIRQAATACGGFAIHNETNYRPDGTTSTNKDHKTHVHVSPENNCGCR